MKKRYGKRAVLTGEITQSGGEIYFMWEKVVKDLKLQKKQFRSCLVLGVAGGTVIELLQKQFPTILITGVELDPVMIEIAREHFVLQDFHNIHLVKDDAVKFVANKMTKRFDLIVVDLYVKEFNPPESRTPQFINHVKEHLNPKGTVLYNAHYQGEKEYQELLTLMKQEFSTVTEVFSYPLNRVLLLHN